MKLQDLYTSVTDDIIAQLEQGVKPWQSPTNLTTAPFPSNAVTKRPYSGMNVVMLWMTARAKGYSSNEYLTFKQAQDIGAKVKKGEKATPVIYVNYKDVEQDDGTSVKRPFAKVFYVFNRAQVDGLPEVYAQSIVPPDHERYKQAMRFLHRSGVKIEYGFKQAAYYPHEDVIRMPSYGEFISDERFFSTSFHELTHAGGHKTRCNRTLDTKWRSPAYKMEEVVAEMGSAFLCAKHGYPYTDNHPSYIDHWVKAMKEDKTVIFKCAAIAGQTVDYYTQQVEAYKEPAKAPDLAPAI